ncbi:MAG: cyclic nucleotide-binding domain-containing protein [Nitrosomonadales bacterium]|nr:cyclic nucleotide-binding domain-containing protein [Nitrosomonadales bacterium]
MSLVIDTLRISTITEELNDAEISIISGLFEVQDFKAGQALIRPGVDQPDSLYILAHGEIQVRIQSSEGDAAIHVLRPGDLAGIITFAGGTSEHISATLTAVGDTKVLSMPKAKFETLINTHPMIVYKVMRGVVRDVHGIVRRMNAQSVQLSNYIYRIHGRY